jgi:hypothetical protein
MDEDEDLYSVGVKTEPDPKKDSVQNGSRKDHEDDAKQSAQKYVEEMEQDDDDDDSVSAICHTSHD